MKFHFSRDGENQSQLNQIVPVFLLIAAIMLLGYGLFHFSDLILQIRHILQVLSPIIYGFCIAYVLSGAVNFMEKSVIYPYFQNKGIEISKKRRRIIRWIVVILSIVMMFLIIYGLMMMMIPQLIKSITNVINNTPGYVVNGTSMISHWLEGLDTDNNLVETFNSFSTSFYNWITTYLLPQMQDMVFNISSGIFDILNLVMNFIIGAIVAIYVLADKEHFIARAKMVLYVLFPVKTANSIIQTMRFTHQTFGGFISGKILDSVIIGILCYIGTSILRMPYNLLISVIVGVTNVIPFFGPYFGAVPCVILITLDTPIKGLYFLLFILVLQQFDGNILGPKILGDSTGLSSFMVIVAILCGGGFFGVIGMIVGVPIAAVLYAFIWRLITHLLSRRKMPVDERSYLGIDIIEEDGTIRPLLPKPKKKRAASADPDGLFMRFWSIVSVLVTATWQVLWNRYIFKIFLHIETWLLRQFRKMKEGLSRFGIFISRCLERAKVSISIRFPNTFKQLKNLVNEIKEKLEQNKAEANALLDNLVPDDTTIIPAKEEKQETDAESEKTETIKEDVLSPAEDAVTPKDTPDDDL